MAVVDTGETAATVEGLRAALFAAAAGIVAAAVAALGFTPARKQAGPISLIPEGQNS